MGKSEFEITIHNLLEKVEEYIEEQNGDPHDYQNILSNFSFNTITTLILSKNYEHDDQDYRLFKYSTQNMFAAMEKLNIILTGNVWKFLLKFKPDIQKRLADNYKEIILFGQKMVNERMKTYDPNNCNDLLDYWIKEIDQIGEDVAGFIMGGTDTSSALLYHSLHLMGLYPDVQRRVFEEIDNTVGTEGLFCYLDKERMPYTQAVIAEIFRFVILAPLGNPHESN
ncbi:hypothetical protein B4U80_00886 [Leptotrombidium deliense]|uniref:Uncharacterized protein n=1 Tax=Leptotrombidium deliense TaxID=299467 RepID=A0A443RZI3_9ACAR|nr:hypothetical protein B4U80_00886 [Leptotrombidium deliense]